MSMWMMNFMFRIRATTSRISQFTKIEDVFSPEHVKKYLYKDLQKHEYAKTNSFKYLYLDKNATDPIEKAFYRALGNVKQGEISYPEYYKIVAKINDLKKIRFAETYDGYKVVSDLGSTRERELFKLYDQVIRNERGELAHKLWKQRLEKDPQARGIVGHL